jgi:hypothetical protein
MKPNSKLLIAASSSIGKACIRQNIADLPTEWSGGVVCLDSNNALKSIVKDFFSEVVYSDARSFVGFRKLISEVSHLVLLWDGEDLSRLLFEARIQKVVTKLIPISVTKVVNKKMTNDFDYYIGRGTPWGNPFAIGHGDGPDRAEVIEKFRVYFEQKVSSDPAYRKGLFAMKGMRLACFCKPDACHGDVIAEYLDAHENLDDIG